MALTLLQYKEISNALMQPCFVLYEEDIKTYSFIDLKCKVFATFNTEYILATIHTQPGKLYDYEEKDLSNFLRNYKKNIVILPTVLSTTNNLPDNYKMTEIIIEHPLNTACNVLSGLSKWMLLDNGDAVRYYLYTNYTLYGSRAAYVSKSARIRIKDNQWLTVGHRSSDYGMSLDNLQACDDMLIKLGFNLKEV